MEQLAQDLFVALEESESCGPIHFEQKRKWGVRRKTRSAENLNIYTNNVDHSDENSSSSNSEIKLEEKCKVLKRISVSFHHSDSDDMPLNFCTVSRAFGNSRTQSLRMKHPLQSILRGRYKGVNYSLESDSVTENSPRRPGGAAGRPNQRRKRKLKRMSVDEEAPQHYYSAQSGKRKRAHHRMDCASGLGVAGASRDSALTLHRRIRPLHPSVVDKIERFCQLPAELQVDADCCADIVSESSLSWSGGEGHDGDDELTDWAPAPDTVPMDTSPLDTCDGREVRAGCRRLGDEPTPGFSISTAASERVARFVQDATETELKLCPCTDTPADGASTVPPAAHCVNPTPQDAGARARAQLERDKLSQLATLYSLDLWFDGRASLLRKTDRTPCMRPPHCAATPCHRHAHHAPPTAAAAAPGHKKIRTIDRTRV